MTSESKRHSDLRAEIVHIRDTPGYPDQPWREFITFAESLDDGIGPLFGLHAAHVGRYVRSLEEQLEAVVKQRDAIMAMLEAERPPEEVFAFFRELHGVSSPASGPE